MAGANCPIRLCDQLSNWLRPYFSRNRFIPNGLFALADEGVVTAVFHVTYVEKTGVNEQKIAQSKALLESDSHAHFHLINLGGTLDL